MITVHSGVVAGIEGFLIDVEVLPFGKVVSVSDPPCAILAINFPLRKLLST